MRFRITSRIVLWIATSVAGVLGVLIGFSMGERSVESMLSYGVFLGIAFGLAGFGAGSIVILIAKAFDYLTDQGPIVPGSIEADYDDRPRPSPSVDRRRP